MKQKTRLWQCALTSANWQSKDLAHCLPSETQHWLQESASLSQRLAKYCACFRVQVLQERPYSLAELTPEEQGWLNRRLGIERLVVLWGDDKPWVFARSLIPFDLFEHSPLHNLGDTPLGLRVFCDPDAYRDGLQLAQCDELWARRSRLWCVNRPLLVAELFLRDAPIYQREKAVC